jgi:hypothetical protein
MTNGRALRDCRLAGLLAATFLLTAGSAARADILVSRSVYAGTPSTVTVGQTLPGGGTAIADGTYPFVFNNNTVDGSFGVTSPIFLDHLSNSGALLYTLAVPGSLATTSFSSKSEMALNLAQAGGAVTFMGYVAAPNTLDVSNSNTPGHVDPTNPVAGVFQRAVVQVDGHGNVLVTPVNTYSGNNGRAAVLAANGQYYMAGNAGNGSGIPPTNIVNNTGVQTTTPGGGPETTVIGNQQGTPGKANGFQYGFSVTQVGLAADKSGKDNNYRGLTIFGNTLYVSKGSGGNGVNTVYQVGIAGTLPTPGTAVGTAINILPGFPTVSAKVQANGFVSNGVSFPFGFTPFGIWFANPTTLYVANEGDGVLGHAGMDPMAGLTKWSLVGGVWQFDYTLQAGLNLGVPYSVAGYPTGINPVTGLPWAPETDGLRNIIGQVNPDGTTTIYGVTSTVSGSGDQGADPNMVVAITDLLSATTLPAGESFTTLEGPVFGTVYRGVAVIPSDFLVPEPSTLALLGLGGAGLAAWRWRQRKA